MRVVVGRMIGIVELKSQCGALELQEVCGKGGNVVEKVGGKEREVTEGFKSKVYGSRKAFAVIGVVEIIGGKMESNIAEGIILRGENKVSDLAAKIWKGTSEVGGALNPRNEV
ncbi:hypothetical protein VNO78_26969 [Psophocarpus tetragonolobus]|uniref:Uncharacterized protein n=1 Tax=Psophocarpus tetragonolobus TaxID=3891 RepID=A0AAN9S000_PSOTE